MANAERITAKRVRELLDYDAFTGLFYWRADRMCGRYMKQFAARRGGLAGSINKDGRRIQLRVDGGNYKAHQIAWLHFYGIWPESEIDHKNTDATDNRIENLRLATRYINNQNRRKANKNSELGVLGVKPSKNRKRFVAQITIDKKNTYLGTFDSKDAAMSAYLDSKRANHEGSTL